jgi:hypothetical protein
LVGFATWNKAAMTHAERTIKANGTELSRSDIQA